MKKWLIKESTNLGDFGIVKVYPKVIDTSGATKVGGMKPNSVEVKGGDSHSEQLKVENIEVWEVLELELQELGESKEFNISEKQERTLTKQI